MHTELPCLWRALLRLPLTLKRTWTSARAALILGFGGGGWGVSAPESGEFGFLELPLTGSNAKFRYRTTGQPMD